MQFGPDELDDPMVALPNLKQTRTVSEYHKSSIKQAFLVDDSEMNLISLFLAGLREDLREKVKLDKPMRMVASYRSAHARELIVITGKRLSKFQSYEAKNPLHCILQSAKPWPLSQPIRKAIHTSFSEEVDSNTSRGV